MNVVSALSSNALLLSVKSVHVRVFATSRPEQVVNVEFSGSTKDGYSEVILRTRFNTILRNRN
jgi:hypothetical protein